MIRGIGGAAPPGGGGAATGGRGGSEPGACGTEGLEVVSESEYEPCSSAPVSMPPLVFFSLGIPPAKSPPNCGAGSTMLAVPPGVSLLLRFLAFEGTGGASPAGGLMPGTGGAPPTGPLPELDLFSICGADLSFVTVDFNFLPLPKFLFFSLLSPIKIFVSMSPLVFFILVLCSCWLDAIEAPILPPNFT